MPNLAWIGLGNMGIAMAKNLAEGTKPASLKVYNRTLTRSRLLEESSSAIIDVAESLDEIVLDTDIIFICLSDDSALSMTIDALLSTKRMNKKIICDMSTVHPNTTATEAAKIQQTGGQFVAAPVFGAPAAAIAAQLVIAKAGDSDALTILDPYFQHMARASFNLGNAPQLASLMKITGNSFILSMIETIAEGLTFSEVSGLGVDNCMQFLSLMFGGTPWEAYAKRMTSGGYMPAGSERPGFASSIALKDCNHALDLATHGNPSYQMSILEHVKQNLETVCKEEAFEGRADVSSVYGIERLRAGLKIENSAVSNRQSKP